MPGHEGGHGSGSLVAAAAEQHGAHPCFESARVAGEDMDKSCEPVYRVHLQAIYRAYALEGSAEVRSGAPPGW